MEKQIVQQPKEDFAYVDFGDKRLNKRLQKIVENKTKNAQGSILGSSGGRSQAKAFYRLLGNENFEMENWCHQQRDQHITDCNSDGNYQKAYNNAVELVAYLMRRHSISIDNIVRHYDACAKNCPASMAADNWRLWTQFKQAVLDRAEAPINVVYDDGNKYPYPPQRR